MLSPITQTEIATVSMDCMCFICGTCNVRTKLKKKGTKRLISPSHMMGHFQTGTHQMFYNQKVKRAMVDDDTTPYIIPPRVKGAARQRPTKLIVSPEDKYQQLVDFVELNSKDWALSPGSQRHIRCVVCANKGG